MKPIAFSLALAAIASTGFAQTAQNATQAQIAAIRFGDEGQEWRMMPIAEYLAHPRAVPHFRDWIRAPWPAPT